MKHSFNASVNLNKYFALALLFFSQGLLWAQDKKVDVTLSVDKGEDVWYGQPWLWIVGAAVFIIIIVALMRGGGKSND